ncbi:MAG: TldD/PmbA family protein [Candidatus Bathyarchaeia archaeon]|jgi:TldD protein
MAGGSKTLDRLRECVEQGEKFGAEFVEARYDNLVLRTLQRINDTWKDIVLRSRVGVGIVCYYDGTSGYSFTSSDTKEDLRKTVEQSFKMAKAAAKVATLKLGFGKRAPVKSRKSDTYPVKVHPRTKRLDYKTELVNRAVKTAQEFGKNVNNVTGSYGELYGRKVFTNSEGSVVDWDFEIVDLQCLVISKTSGGELVMGHEQKGGTAGMEVFQKKGSAPEDIGKAAATQAAEQLKAKSCPGGKFRALIENRLGGVLAHESFGHLSEGDFVVIGGSPLAGKIGKRLGTEHATIVDHGTPDLGRFGGLWVPFDDQGIEAHKTVVLDKGIFRHYLHNRGTAERLHEDPTGNCRAIHYGFMPIPRMTNTYFAPGDLSRDEALELLGTGVYAIQTSGGQVEDDGSFVFKAIRGYWVKNGKIQEPLREVALSGNILELLTKFEGATKELHIEAGYFGGCGKSGQAPLPVGLGSPELVIGDVTFGGKAE